jgi:hypothetical protein
MNRELQMALSDPTALDLQDPLLRQLHAYWLEKRGNRAMPARADIDPLDMRFILGSLTLVDVLYAPLRFRIRLHGTDHVHRAGYDLTGKMLDELPVSEFRQFAKSSFTATVETRVPRAGIRDRVMDGRIYRYEALLLPLSSDGGAVDMLLAGMRYIDRK